MPGGRPKAAPLEPRRFAAQEGPGANAAQESLLALCEEEERGRTAGLKEKQEREGGTGLAGGVEEAAGAVCVRGDGSGNGCNKATYKQKAGNIALKPLAVSQNNTDFFFFFTKVEFV